MKRKIFISLFFYFIFFNLHASEIKFEKVIHGLNNPWSLSFIDNEKIIFTEKSGKLYTLNLQNKKISKIDHNLNVKNMDKVDCLMFYITIEMSIFPIPRIEVIGLQALQ